MLGLEKGCEEESSVVMKAKINASYDCINSSKMVIIMRSDFVFDAEVDFKKITTRGVINYNKTSCS